MDQAPHRDADRLVDTVPEEGDEVATTLSNGGKVKYSVDIWSPDSGDKSEVVQMIDALRNIDVEVNIIPIRNLYKPELHVGFDEYVGLGGVRRFLDEHRKSSQ